MLALGLVSPLTFAAEGAEAGADSSKSSSKESADKSKSAMEEQQPSDATMGDYQLGGKATVFGGESSGTSFTQQAASADYQLSGSGITGGRGGQQGIMMTSPTRGRALGLTEGIYVFPAAMVGIGYNDNVTAVSKDKIGSSIVLISPEVVAEVKNRGDRYTVGYQGNYGLYQNSNADNFNDHSFWVGADNYWTTRFRTGVGAGYIIKTDARGS